LKFKASKIEFEFEIDFEEEIILSKIILEVSERQFAAYLKEKTNCCYRFSIFFKSERQVLSESRIESKHKIGFNEVNFLHLS
jgi:hypothetical protein